MLVAINSRMKLKVISESARWKDATEISLPFQDHHNIEADYSSSDGPRSTEEPVRSIVFAARPASDTDSVDAPKPRD